MAAIEQTMPLQKQMMSGPYLLSPFLPILGLLYKDPAIQSWLPKLVLLKLLPPECSHTDPLFLMEQAIQLLGVADGARLC